MPRMLGYCKANGWRNSWYTRGSYDGAAAFLKTNLILPLFFSGGATTGATGASAIAGGGAPGRGLRALLESGSGLRILVAETSPPTMSVCIIGDVPLMAAGAGLACRFADCDEVLTFGLMGLGGLFRMDRINGRHLSLTFIRTSLCGRSGAVLPMSTWGDGRFGTGLLVAMRGASAVLKRSKALDETVSLSTLGR